MDVLFRLRVLIWILVLGLWGIMVYQFLGEEQAEKAQIAYLRNPYQGKRAPEQVFPAREPVPEPAAQSAPPLGPAQAASPSEAPTPIERLPSNPELLAAAPPPLPKPAPSSLDYINPLPLPTPLPRRQRSRTPVRPERGLKQSDPAIPSGFVKTVTRHFNVYAEGDAASEQFVSVLENLHGNLMLDLAAFSPWASEEKVSVFLFKTQEAYREVTGRPAWSGGASSVPKRKVYVYESEELPGILAHELCHIYYDGFFLSGRADPLWLSEGMATLVQVERGMAAPSWLRENLEILERGGGFTMAQMMSVNSTADSPDDKVRLWYAQAYSTVRFLIRSQYRSNFYKFSDYLRDGKDTTQALYRAYGMPYNRLKALEYAWRYELASNSLSRLSSDR